MKSVKDLIEVLKTLDPNAKLFCGYDGYIESLYCFVQKSKNDVPYVCFSNRDIEPVVYKDANVLFASELEYNLDDLFEDQD